MTNLVRAITRLQDADDFDGVLTDSLFLQWDNGAGEFTLTAAGFPLTTTHNYGDAEQTLIQVDDDIGPTVRLSLIDGGTNVQRLNLFGSYGAGGADKAELLVKMWYSPWLYIGSAGNSAPHYFGGGAVAHAAGFAGAGGYLAFGEYFGPRLATRSIDWQHVVHAATSTGLRIQLAAAPTEYAFQVVDSTAAMLTEIDETGRLIIAGNGDVNSPAVQIGDGTKGIYGASDNQIIFGVAGATQLQIGNGKIIPHLPMRALDGSLAAPSYSFNSETGSGIYRAGAGLIDFVRQGVKWGRIDGFGWTFEKDTYVNNGNHFEARGGVTAKETDVGAVPLAAQLAVGSSQAIITAADGAGDVQWQVSAFGAVTQDGGLTFAEAGESIKYNGTLTMGSTTNGQLHISQFGTPGDDVYAVFDGANGADARLTIQQIDDDTTVPLLALIDIEDAADTVAFTMKDNNVTPREYLKLKRSTFGTSAELHIGQSGVLGSIYMGGNRTFQYDGSSISHQVSGASKFVTYGTQNWSVQPFRVAAGYAVPVADFSVVGQDASTPSVLINETVGQATNSFEIRSSAGIARVLVSSTGLLQPYAGLTVQAGDLTMHSTGQMILPDGSAANPAIVFSDDPDTGIFRSGANWMSLIAGNYVGLEVRQGNTYSKNNNLVVSTNKYLTVSAGYVDITTMNASTTGQTINLSVSQTAKPWTVKNSSSADIQYANWDGSLVVTGGMAYRTANGYLSLQAGGTLTVKDGSSQTLATFVHNGGGTLRNAGTTRFEWDGTGTSVNGATPVAQAAHIADPSGGATQDAEARTTINAILVALENFGITAAS